MHNIKINQLNPTLTKFLTQTMKKCLVFVLGDFGGGQGQKQEQNPLKITPSWDINNNNNKGTKSSTSLWQTSTAKRKMGEQIPR